MQNGEWNPDWKPVHARHTVHLQEEWKQSTKGRSGHIILILSFAQYAFIIHKNSQYVAGIYIHIYFGGGTPSLLSAASIRRILESIDHHFRVSRDAEITLEANPDDMDAERLSSWKSAGINRLSIGIQSFFLEDLQWMNRAHNAKQSVEAIEIAKKAGFDNFSLDLIYGSP